MVKRLKNAYSKKPDLFSVSVITGAFLFVVVFNLFILRRGVAWGSDMDWSSQHFMIPEYIRMRFLETGDHHPDFAMQLGGGQNIYNLAYYGMANPLYLPAYFMPCVNMAVYVQGVSMAGVLVSALMSYYFFKRHFRGMMPLLLGLMFLFAAPLIFHSHRHIMFVNYYPFLMALLFAVRGRDSALNCFLTGLFSYCIMCTSYFYSVGSFAAVGTYMVFSCIEQDQKIKVRAIAGRIWKKLVFIVIGCVCAAHLWMPAFAAIISGRASTSVEVPLTSLIIPVVNFGVLLYSPYSAGMSCFSPVSIIALLRNGTRSERFLAGVMAGCVLLPLIVYLMNGTMYVDGKAFIPFIPLLLIICGRFFDRLKERKVDLRFTVIVFAITAVLSLTQGSFSKSQLIIVVVDTIFTILTIYICVKKQHLRAVTVMAIVFSFSICMVTNAMDTLVKRDTIRELYSTTQKELVENILDEDTDLYRFAEDASLSMTVNQIYRTDYLTTNIYSSLSNPEFRNFRFYSSGSEIGTRNNAIHKQPKNIVFNTLMGCRYRLVRNDEEMFGEHEVASDGDYRVLKNDYALPLGYACANAMAAEHYKHLQWELQQETLLDNIIIPSDMEGDARFPESTERLDIDFGDLSDTKGMTYSNRTLTVNSKKPIHTVLPLDEPISGKVLILTAFADNRIGRLSHQADAILIVNGVKNKLTDPNWKYNNGNYAFSYIISSDEPITELKMDFSAGNYNISGLEAYTMDGSVLSRTMDNKDALIIDKEEHIGDSISGTVNVRKDGWFNFSIPYDKYFEVRVDGEKVDYYRTNLAFIGFPITAGEHRIELEYHAPMRLAGIRVTMCGVFAGAVMLIVAAAFDVKRKKKENLK